MRKSVAAVLCCALTGVSAHAVTAANLHRSKPAEEPSLHEAKPGDVIFAGGTDIIRTGTGIDRVILRPSPMKFRIRCNSSHDTVTVLTASRKVFRSSKRRIQGCKTVTMRRAPVVRTAPKVEGDTTVGQTLTANPGSWVGPKAVRTATEWQRCRPSGTCQSTGRTGRTYTVSRADLGRELRVRVIATSAGRSAVKHTVRVGPVRAVKPSDPSDRQPQNPQDIPSQPQQPSPPQPSSVPFAVGVHTGARDIDYRATRSLRPGLVRVGGLTASTPRATIEDIAVQYAALGAKIVPLVDFNGQAPSEADARNVGTWATVPGVEAIEYGNEPWLLNEAWDYAQYARSFKAANDAVLAANPKLTVIAVGDSANRSHRPGLQVMQAMKAAGVRPRAVQFHPYGPDYGNRLFDLKRDLVDVGWAGTQIWASEVGVATDNGRTLYQGGTPNNYGWNPAMTYTQAAATVEQIVAGLRDGGVSRVMLYMGTDYAAPGASNEREYYFGLTTSTGADKGALTSAVRNLLSSYRG